MAGERTIRIKVDGDSRGLNDMAQRGRKSVGDLDKSFKGMSTGAKLALATMGVAFAAWVGQTAASMMNVQRLAAQTDTVLKSMQVAWTDTGHITAYAEKIEALSGIEMEQVQTGQNLLLTYGNITNQVGKGNDVFDQATMLMTDLSVATGKDMSGAATLLGKALNDPIRGVGALTKVGVTFTEQQKAQIKALVESGDVMGAQKVILAELTRQFGGSAKAFGETTAGQVLKLQNQFGNLSEELLTDLLPALNSVLSVASDVIGWLQENQGLVVTLAAALGGLAATWLLVHGAVKLVNATTSAWNGLASLARGSTIGLGTSFAALSTAAKVASLSMGAIGLVATVIGVALSLFSGHTSEAEDRQQKLAAASKDVAKVLDEENEQLNKRTRAAAAAALEESGLLKVVEAHGVSTQDLTDAYLGNNDARTRLNAQIRQHIKDLNEEEDAALAAGDANRASDIDREIDSYRGLQSEVDGAIGVREQDSEAIDRQHDATEGSTGATQDATTAIEQNIEALQQQIDLMREAAGEVLGQREAERSLIDTFTEATNAVKENGYGIDNNTEAGRKNNAVLDDIANGTYDLIDAQAKNGASSDQLSRTMEVSRQKFIATAIQMGYTETQANDLANQLKLIPTAVQTRVTLDDNFARQRAREFADLIRNIPASKIVDLRVGVSSGGHQIAGDHRATGGPVFAGQIYEVGERGREFLKMGNSSGTVIPNHQLGDGGDVAVFITIDGQQLQGRIDRTVKENDRQTKRRASAGTGSR
jgi:hypothetical protein